MPSKPPRLCVAITPLIAITKQINAMMRLNLWALESNTSAAKKDTGNIITSDKSLGSPSCERSSREIVTRVPSTRPIPFILLLRATKAMAAPEIMMPILTTLKCFNVLIHHEIANTIMSTFVSTPDQYSIAKPRFEALKTQTVSQINQTKNIR